MKFPTMTEMAKEVAEKALDEYEYKGKTIRQWIDEIISLENKTSDWIPVTERLPEEYGWYLCSRYNHEELPTIDMWYFSIHDSLESAQGTGIVAWMPLPEAYKGEEK